MEMQSDTSSYSVKEIQAEMLVLLKYFHKLCIENGINYSVHAGTMIGAVRDHGFIEWDDDADISFTRDNYNKFVETVSRSGLIVSLSKTGDTDNLNLNNKSQNIDQELSDRRILGHTNDSGSVYKNSDVSFYFSQYDNAFPQLWMKREGHPAVWLDFFIYDYITTNKFKQKIKLIRIAALLGLLKNKRTMYLTKQRGIYKGVKYAIIYAGYLAGRTMTPEKKHRHAEKVRQSFAGDRTHIHRSNDRYVGIGFVYPKEIMSEYMLMDFEDTQLMITKNYDDILIPSYGDYMTPKKLEDGEAVIHDIARDVLPGPGNSGE